jgi:hypothetical protein
MAQLRPRTARLAPSKLEAPCSGKRETQVTGHAGHAQVTRLPFGVTGSGSRGVRVTLPDLTPLPDSLLVTLVLPCFVESAVCPPYFQLFSVMVDVGLHLPLDPVGLHS